jgi:hypothetical protein
MEGRGREKGKKEKKGKEGGEEGKRFRAKRA